jgi:hypothetical protein
VWVCVCARASLCCFHPSTKRATITKKKKAKLKSTDRDLRNSKRSIYIYIYIGKVHLRKKKKKSRSSQRISLPLSGVSWTRFAFASLPLSLGAIMGSFSAHNPVKTAIPALFSSVQRKKKSSARSWSLFFFFFGLREGKCLRTCMAAVRQKLVLCKAHNSP